MEVGHGDAARVSPVLPTFQQAAIGRWEREFRIRLARGHEFISHLKNASIFCDYLPIACIANSLGV